MNHHQTTATDYHCRLSESQAWFWTSEWQAGEREADEDLAAGRSRIFQTEAEFDAFLAGLPDRSST